MSKQLFTFHLHEVDCELLVSLNFSTDFTRQFIGMSNIWSANSESSALGFRFVQLYFSALNLRIQQVFSFLIPWKNTSGIRLVTSYCNWVVIWKRLSALWLVSRLVKIYQKHHNIICKEKSCLSRAAGSGKKLYFLAVKEQTHRARCLQMTPHKAQLSSTNEQRLVYVCCFQATGNRQELHCRSLLVQF